MLATHQGQIRGQVPQLGCDLAKDIFPPSAIQKHLVFQPVTIRKGCAEPEEAAWIQQKLATGALPLRQAAAAEKSSEIKVLLGNKYFKKSSPNKEDPSSLNSCYLTSKSLVIYGLHIAESHKSFLWHFTVSILTSFCFLLSLASMMAPGTADNCSLASAVLPGSLRTGSLYETRRGAHHTAITLHHEQPTVLLHHRSSLPLFS